MSGSNPDRAPSARVVLSLPQPRADGVAELLRARGHEVLLLPFTRIGPLTGRPAVSAVLAALERFDRVVFVSPMAIEIVLDALGGRWPDRVAPAIVGPGSREALARYGLDHHPALAVPEGPVFDAAALLALPALARPRGERILVVRAEGGNTQIETELARRGAQATALEAYQRQTVEPAAELLAQLAEWLAEGGGALSGAASSRAQELPQIVVTTVGASQALARLADSRQVLAALRYCTAIAIHPRIAASLSRLGWTSVTATAPGVAALLATIESGHRAAEGPSHRSGTECD